MLDVAHRGTTFQSLGIDAEGSRTRVTNPEDSVLWAKGQIRWFVSYVISLQRFDARLMADMEEWLNRGIDFEPRTSCRGSIVRHKPRLN
jgi:hypothetical protein